MLYFFIFFIHCYRRSSYFAFALWHRGTIYPMMVILSFQRWNRESLMISMYFNHAVSFKKTGTVGQNVRTRSGDGACKCVSVKLGFRPRRQTPCRKGSLEGVLGSCAKYGVCLQFAPLSRKRIYAYNAFRKRDFKFFENLFSLF